jgi:outer membrane protein assembly factor BamB
LRKLARAGLGIAVLAIGVAAGYVLYLRHEGRNIHGSSTVEFAAPTTVAAPTTGSSARRTRTNQTIDWPMYGFDAARLRVATGVTLRPPLRHTWTFHGRALLEFPPAVGYGRVFLTTFDGRTYALDARTGRSDWHDDSGRCGWASPAVDRQLVFVALIGHACDSAVPGSDGEVVAFDATTGRIRWRRVIGPVESSPLVANGLVFVGDWLGRVYALSEQSGRIRWAYTASGKIKGSVALSGHRVFVGAYDGHVYALDARTGRLIWRATGQPRLGGTGTFYATPAVAYDRVYIGSTDGRVYSFGAQTGRLRWSYATGGYVYASPAIWRQLVLVGSYDHQFYAFDAATGALRWRFRANGPISGSATVVDGLVYFSTFNERTYALNAATGHEVWTWPDGKYSPVVAGDGRLYLTGLGRLYAFVRG